MRLLKLRGCFLFGSSSWTTNVHVFDEVINLSSLGSLYSHFPNKTDMQITLALRALEHTSCVQVYFLAPRMPFRWTDKECCRASPNETEYRSSWFIWSRQQPNRNLMIGSHTIISQKLGLLFEGDICIEITDGSVLYCHITRNINKL